MTNIFNGITKILTWAILWLPISVTSKKSPNVYKSCPKMISLEKWKISKPLQKLSTMWAIWAKSLLPQALKSWPNCNKSPNLVTLPPMLLLLAGTNYLPTFHFIHFWISHSEGVAVKLNRLTWPVKATTFISLPVKQSGLSCLHSNLNDRKRFFVN